jgi:RNA polymerase sigma-70 factor (ECF subfamily)
MPQPSPSSEEFVELMTAHQGRLYGYVLSLLGDPDQANDVLQEANVVLWRKSEEYRPGSNFRAWAFRIAHFQTMAHRQKQLRDKVLFDDEVLALLEPAAREVDELYEQRERLLAGCLEKLGAYQRDLLLRRYNRGQSLQAIAEEFRKTTNSVAQALFRIRQRLIDCVTRSATAGEAS